MGMGLEVAQSGHGMFKEKLYGRPPKLTREWFGKEHRYAGNWGMISRTAYLKFNHRGAGERWQTPLAASHNLDRIRKRVHELYSPYLMLKS
jgi:hypothetical protein